MFGKNPPPTNHFDTLVSGKAEVVGDVHFSGGLHIDGKVFGNIIAEDDSKAVLRISDKGLVEGEVSVPHVVINGTVVGDIHSCEHIELAAKAIVKGNVFYNTIEMVMGAQVDGRMAHRYKANKGGEKPRMPKQVTREKPRSGAPAADAAASSPAPSQPLRAEAPKVPASPLIAEKPEKKA